MENKTQNNPLKVAYSYSKSSEFYLDTKKDFFSENDRLLQKSITQNKLYAKQSKRDSCKLCGNMLPLGADFNSHDVGYVFCSSCGHLNGQFEDTQEFIEKLYIEDGGVEYSANYVDDSYWSRVKDVYLPKLDFLIKSLPTKEYKILDVGCGGGYFVASALHRGFAVNGFDVSRTMVDFGNAQINRRFNELPLACTSEDGFYEAVQGSSAEVITAIGVIEHLREPMKFFDAFRTSQAKYLYYSVPMFSLSAVLENVMTDVFPRQLSGAHTHLFTEQSLIKMHEIIGVQPIAQWRFGTDAMDLYRHLIVSLQANNSSIKTVDYLSNSLRDVVDGLQSVLDRAHFCSEVHCVATKL